MNIKKVNIKNKRYITSEGDIINNNEAVEYNDENLKETLILTFYDENADIIKREFINKRYITKDEALFLCLKYHAKYCSFQVSYEVI